MRSLLNNVSTIALMRAAPAEVGTAVAPTKGKGNMRQQAAAKANQAKATASFTVVVHDGGAILTFQDGETLSLKRQIVDFFKAHADEPKLDDVTDDAILAVIGAADVTGMTPEDANVARLAALTVAPFLLHGTEEIPSVIGDVPLPMKGTASWLARTYGEKVGAATATDLTTGVEATKDADATPIRVMQDLLDDTALTDEFWDALPPIGSKYREGKGDKAPFGYRLPSDTTAANAALPIWNGPWDYYRNENRSGTGPSFTNGHFVGGFVAAKIALAWARRIDHIKLRKQNALADGCPADLKEMTDPVKLQAEMDEAAFQFNKRVKYVSQAFKLVQKKRAIEARFPHIKVALIGIKEYDETLREAARRRKPFTLVTETDLGNGRVKEACCTAITVGKIANMEPSKYPTNASVAAITTVKRGNKGETKAVAHLKEEIKTTERFEEYVSAVGNYADQEGSHQAIMAKCVSPADGGQLASAIVLAHAKLNRIANNADVQRLASQYLDNSAKSLANANAAAPATTAVAKVG